jgi:hypothetical protein
MFVTSDHFLELITTPRGIVCSDHREGAVVAGLPAPGLIKEVDEASVPGRAPRKDTSAESRTPMS